MTAAATAVWCISCRTRPSGLPLPNSQPSSLSQPPSSSLQPSRSFYNLSYIHLTASLGFLLIYLLSKLCCSKNLTTYFISVTFLVARAHTHSAFCVPTFLAHLLVVIAIVDYGIRWLGASLRSAITENGGARTAAHCANSTNLAARKCFAGSPNASGHLKCLCLTYCR